MTGQAQERTTAGTFLTRVPIVFAAAMVLAACAGRPPVIDTKVIERPVPVFCQPALPAECMDAYAVDRVSPADSAVTINRAMQAELEQRRACEIKLRAAIKGCADAGTK